jgi:hypothetical protein
MWRTQGIRCVVALLLAMSANYCQALTQLTFPLTSEGVDSRYDYDWAVLRMAMEKTRPAYGSYRLHQSDVAMSPQRVLQEMSAPQGRINVSCAPPRPNWSNATCPSACPWIAVCWATACF